MGNSHSCQSPPVVKPVEGPSQQSRILLLDFYDSFTHNLAALLRSSTDAIVDVVSHDHYSTLTELQADLSYYDALVIGPGPGSPDDRKDIGVAKDLWTKLPDEHLLPIFGVCLGLQSLCIAFGGQLKRLDVVKHGIISPVTHVGRDIFEGVQEIKAVRYHSLHVDMREVVGGGMEELAWTTDEGENGTVLMAAKHATRPYWAVQYHPESVCTEGGGELVVRNWWRLAGEWNKRNGRASRCSLIESSRWTSRWASWRRVTERRRSLPTRPRSLLERAILRQKYNTDVSAMTVSDVHQVNYATILAQQLLPTQICEILGAGNQSNDFVFLDSAASPGRYSIIGVLSEVSTQILRYHAGATSVDLSTLGQTPRVLEKIPLNLPGTKGGCIWEFLAKFMAKRQVPKDMGPAESPFWGGLIGYFSYEMGVQSLDIPVPERKSQRPDVQLMYIQRSIVVDNWSRNIYIQTIRENDGDWLEAIKSTLQMASEMPITPSPTPPLNFSSTISSATALAAALSKASSEVPSALKIVRPKKELYIQNIKKAQEYLAAGHSYELCLTALTEIHLPLPSPNAWALFTNLRARNPAPYSAYLRFPDVTIVSSSPERFLSWSRDGLCQLRPIKGTVKKTPTTTLEYAKSILHTQKEMAENLMIVDLIRHDLNQVAHEGTVKVEKLMQVEEYKSVYQLVSVIEGRVGPMPDDVDEKCKDRSKGSVSSRAPVSGFDVLARSLPPGSMTGAPKKRSVELLQGLEGEERGIYSGVMGYWSVCGGGDWSVIIRTAFRYDDENDIKRPDNIFQKATSQAGGSSNAKNTQKDSEIWRIGAGGAITALSDPEGEWDEMEVKLESTLRAFIG